MAARTLARAGLGVVVLEEGQHHSTASFGRRTPLDRFAELYRDGGATVAVGNPPLLLPVGRAVGGTTVVNSGTCYRTPDHVLARWTGDFGFSLAERFGPYLDEVERTLRRGHPAAGRPRQQRPARARRGRTPRLAGRAAAPQRARLQGLLPVRGGLPHRRQTERAAVGPARRLRRGSPHRHRRAGPADPRGRRPSRAARARRVCSYGGEDGGEFEILLRWSSSPRVPCSRRPCCAARAWAGIHGSAATSASIRRPASPGRFAEPVTAWEGVLQSVGVEELHDEGVLIEATATPPGHGFLRTAGPGQASCGANWRAPTGSPRSER